MKRIIFSITSILIFCFTNLKGQDGYKYDAALLADSDASHVSFCDKKPNEKSIIIISVDELKKCNWRLAVGAKGLEIFEFRLSIVPKDDKHMKEGVTIKGDQIPEQYRAGIIENCSRFFLEFIKVKNSKSGKIVLKPLQIEIKS